MKIKNIFLSLGLGLAGVAGFTSCDSLFRDFPNDKLPAEVIWEDPLLLDEYVLPWYRNMDRGFYTYVTTIMKGLGAEYEPCMEINLQWASVTGIMVTTATSSRAWRRI